MGNKSNISLTDKNYNVKSFTGLPKKDSTFIDKISSGSQTPMVKNQHRFNSSNVGADQLKLSVDFNDNLFNIEVNKLNKIINIELENQSALESEKYKINDQHKI